MPRLLLDTRAFVWWLSDVSKLAVGAHAAIGDPRNDVFVSATTGWEIAVNRARRRITAPDNLPAIVEEKGVHAFAADLSSRGTGGKSSGPPLGYDRDSTPVPPSLGF